MSELQLNNINLLKNLEEYIMAVMSSLLKNLLLTCNKAEKKEILNALTEMSEGRNLTEIELGESMQNAVESIVFFNELADMVYEKRIKYRNK